jgi:hypothetical protein
VTPDLAWRQVKVVVLGEVEATPSEEVMNGKRGLGLEDGEGALPFLATVEADEVEVEPAGVDLTPEVWGR